jgi:hypothetical protein
MPRHQEYRFTIDTFTPDSIPMARLAEYMTDIAKMLGNKDKVHFVKVEPGSVVLLEHIEEPAIPRFRERLNGIRNRTAPDEAIAAYEDIDRRLAEDNAIGVMETTEGRVFEFPGRNRKHQSAFGSIVQPGTIDGVLIRVGGKDETVPVYLEEGAVIHKCNSNREMAKRLAPYIFGGPLRVYGNGRWSRDDFGNWTMDHFTINDFTELQESTLHDAVTKLRSIPNGLQSVDDPIEELSRIRHGTDDDKGP